MLENILNYFKSNPRKLFLIDGLGGGLSAFSLGIVLANYESTFGMPKHELFYLSLVACLFAIYSLSCYLFKPKNWRAFIKFIAIANLCYCIITLILVFKLQEDLTHFGTLYFLLEIVIVVSLAMLELRTSSK